MKRSGNITLNKNEEALNGRELSGTPEELSGRLYFNLSLRVAGRSRDSGVRCNRLGGLVDLKPSRVGDHQDLSLRIGDAELTPRGPAEVRRRWPPPKGG